MNENLQIEPLSLILSFALVLITIFISYKEKLKLEKDIVVAIMRMFVQLFIVGYVLSGIFSLNNNIVTFLMASVIILNASINTAGRGKDIDNAFRVSIISIYTTSILTLGILVLSKTIKFIPSQVIPITGMLAGSAMRTIGLTFTNMSRFFHDNHQKIEERLALGATPLQASREVIRLTITGAVQPNIDNVKTVGLVTLPGMMSGMMFAGIDPKNAIIYQMIVMMMVLSSSAMSSYIATRLSYMSYFSDKYQLKYK